jgi:hypothetical protein
MSVPQGGTLNYSYLIIKFKLKLASRGPPLWSSGQSS